MTLGSDELERRLGYHRQGPATAPFFELNRALALSVAEVWDQVLPPGREAALALTALQDALMWANAAVACNLDPNTAVMPEVDAGDALEAVLDRLEGPKLTRSGPVAPSTGSDRPEVGRDPTYGELAVEHRRKTTADPELEHRREVAQLEADGSPELTR